MGTDIHPTIEYREVVGYNRPDHVVQQMRHNGEDLTPIEISEWRLGGCMHYENRLQQKGYRYFWSSDIHEEHWVFEKGRLMVNDQRNYLLFAWLTNTIRTYALERFEEAIPSLTDGPRGLPEGSLVEDYDHDASWFSVKELLGHKATLEEYFPQWLEALSTWQDLDARVVFWFDS